MSAARVNWLEILCLANSRKLGGRCVAGVRLDTREWVRPVSSHPQGTLYAADYALDAGRDIDLLDVARIPIGQPAPQPTQPENVLLDAGTWRHVRALHRAEVEPIVEPLIATGPDLLGSVGDRVAAASAQRASLTLVESESLEWQVTSTQDGRRQLRARFALAGHPYNLAVTDPSWEESTRGLPIGWHPRTVGGTKASDRILLTVSIGEPFQGHCYKLVAAIVRLR